MNRELLEKPFERDQIKQRIGTYGTVLDYVEGHTVIKRLNDAFDGKWSFESNRVGYPSSHGRCELVSLLQIDPHPFHKWQFDRSGPRV